MLKKKKKKRNAIIFPDVKRKNMFHFCVSVVECSVLSKTNVVGKKTTEL